LQANDKWYLPDLASWRDYLLFEEEVTETTARAYLSTVRSAYRRILRDNAFRNLLYQQLDDEMYNVPQKVDHKLSSEI
jgi:hypothetical protein